MAVLDKRINKWAAREYSNGRRTSLGYWDSLEEAKAVEEGRRIYASFEQEFILVQLDRSTSRVRTVVQ